MSSELAVIPDRTETLQKLGIFDDGVSSLSKLIKTHIKDHMKLKGADAREEFYRILRDVVAPITAATIQRATAQGWLNELRLGKIKKGKTEVEDFNVHYFKPNKGKIVHLSAARVAEMEKEGMTPRVKEILIREGYIKVDAPRDVESTVVKSEEKALEAPKPEPAAV
jgi:hypothetical protein